MKKVVIATLIITALALAALFVPKSRGQTSNFSQTFIACGTTVTCADTLVSGHIIFGSAPLSSGSPSTAVIATISPAFTSATSYKCVVGDVTTITNNLVVTTYTSGSSFTITGPNTVTDTAQYICVGY